MNELVVIYDRRAMDLKNKEKKRETARPTRRIS